MAKQWRQVQRKMITAVNFFIGFDNDCRWHIQKIGHSLFHKSYLADGSQ
jgi:hypothetical protein